jgi:hypothetical protein
MSLAHTKECIENQYKGKVLFCGKCLKDLTPDEVWLPDDMHDGRIYCYDCAPGDAIRNKDRI